MTIYTIRSIEFSMNLIVAQHKTLASEPKENNVVDSFYYSEAQILSQSLPIDSHLEQICKIY